MKIKNTAMHDMTDLKFRKLILLGRRAIELRLLGMLARPWTKNQAGPDEMERVKALLAQYDELMDEKYWRRRPEEANARDGAKD